MPNKFKFYRYFALLLICFILVIVILSKSGLIELNIFKHDLYKHLMVIASVFALPFLGFPFSALLVAIGIEFDYIIGLVIVVAVIPLHLAISFWIVNRFFRDKIKYSPLASRFRIFDISSEKHLEYTFIFMILPVVPYAVKNYLLPASGIPFRYYFIIGWITQSALAAPFVILGEAASSLDYRVLFALLILFPTFYFVMRKLKERYYKLIAKKEN
ncbi:SNARE associated Golgi protein-like protein [Flexistipes sinusarabici DSM 4947]|uniref:SNARE associated Golgi protein-like protein n=1 Tax=Flexistipes sinusarabici (strain ATCC 49648 / DSM 4947 / MAS 10) TaxID=717231 RepID=F8E4P7_FLESM|nr:hypothetical protein [Flexistipes sinusarabici]AEI15605.1 SNARE associated Golgi protein-like protein [Flexistipes sinusarabici DSM 4947]